ncbi:DUF6344 domain-containing protein [Streptomyces sp. NPDC006372]|uniref:DUF6344 domain-containing protein n=1 Tax=Streptomyces sp. NPDC006372 TaxID=3155599 RepID=UPI0033B97DBD
MARNKVMTLWTTIVAAFVALFTALGFITTTAAAAVPQAEQKRNSERIPQQRTTSASPRTHAKALPPTMKQRIRAEAHGKTPRCRHRPLTDPPSSGTTDCTDDDTDADPSASYLAPLQR